MKKIFSITLLGLTLFLSNCNNDKASETGTATDAATPAGGQEAVQDDESQKDVVKVAVGSADHSTLVAALKQAELVTSLSNAGPFTVFAPTNAALKADLQNILQYHVAVAVYKTENMKDGQIIGQANGDNITLSVKDGKVMINGSANIVASIPASNGIINVIDAVLLPPAKK